MARTVAHVGDSDHAEEAKAKAMLRYQRKQVAIRRKYHRMEQAGWAVLGATALFVAWGLGAGWGESALGYGVIGLVLAMTVLGLASDGEKKANRFADLDMLDERFAGETCPQCGGAMSADSDVWGVRLTCGDCGKEVVTSL